MECMTRDEIAELLTKPLVPVILETPYAGDVATNEAFARACMRDCFARGEAAYASHLLYTQPGVLDDRNPMERALGIEAGLVWGRFARRTVVYVDRGVSSGMEKGIARAHAEGREVVMRWLSKECPDRVVTP